jgi:hypothetical protein
MGVSKMFVMVLKGCPLGIGTQEDVGGVGSKGRNMKEIVVVVIGRKK